jgi:hypothetical protein
LTASAADILKLQDVENARNGGTTNKTISFLAETEYSSPRAAVTALHTVSEHEERSSMKMLRILRAGIIYIKPTQDLFNITTAAILGISTTNFMQP